MKIFRKTLSLLLCVVMLMSMCITVFADDEGTDPEPAPTTPTGNTSDAPTETTRSLTIETTAGHTYLVYQMLVGDISGLKDGSATLANVELGINNNAGSVEAFDVGIRGEDGEYLKDAALSAAAGKFITGTAVEEVLGDGTSKTIEVYVGYYVVEDTWTNGAIKGEAISRYLVAVVGDTTMTPKTTDTPDIDKNITDTDANKALETGDSKKTDTAAIGDVIEFEITGKVPDMTGYKYYYYVVSDTMSEGLTLNDENDSGFTVTVGGKELTRGTDYYVTKDEDGQSFKLSFEDMVNAGFTTGDAISVKYTATINDNAKVGTEPNTNTAKLIYSNNPNHSDRHVPDDHGVPDDSVPTGETPDRTTKTYVTELTIVKVDENMAILDGAEFTLTGTNLNKVKLTSETTFEQDSTGNYYKITVDGKSSYTTAAPTEDKYENGELKTAGTAKYYEKIDDGYVKYALKTTITQTSEEVKDSSVTLVLKNGAFTVSGLNAGEYTLTETKTPAGYNTIADIKFTISASIAETTTTEGNKVSTATDLVGGSVVWASNNAEVKVDTVNGVYDTTIQNVKGNKLPSTGGIGTTIFYVTGAVLVAAAGVVLVAKKRMER